MTKMIRQDQINHRFYCLGPGRVAKKEKKKIACPNVIFSTPMLYWTTWPDTKDAVAVQLDKTIINA